MAPQLVLHPSQHPLECRIGDGLVRGVNDDGLAVGPEPVEVLFDQPARLNGLRAGRFPAGPRQRVLGPRRECPEAQRDHNPHRRDDPEVSGRPATELPDGSELHGSVAHVEVSLTVAIGAFPLVSTIGRSSLDNTTGRANLSRVVASSDQRAASRPLRRQRSDGERSRAAILREAARLATVEGLDGLSLARLAAAVGMSKSGLFAHFGSKEELQLATIDAASAIFDELVIEPAAEEAAGVPRLRAYIERFLDHVEEGVFPGGCFFVSAMGELGTHPGPVRDGAMAFSQRWITLLAQQVAAAQAAGALDTADPSQVAFEINAYMVLGNMQFVASADPAALDRVRRAVDTRLIALAPQARRRRGRPNRPHHEDA